MPLCWFLQGDSKFFISLNVCLCWGLTSQSTIFQSCRDGATASWVINQYFRGVKCLAQGHNTAAVGIESPTSRSGVRHSTTEPPCSPVKVWMCLLFQFHDTYLQKVGWLCWGLTSQSTIFQSCRDGAIASWVINQYFRGVKCLAQGHNTAEVGLEPRTSRSGVRHSTTEPPSSPICRKCLMWAGAWQNQQNDLCTQRRPWSAQASAQSDQSSLCALWVAWDPMLLHADSEDSDWSESLLGAQVILLVLSCSGSFHVFDNQKSQSWREILGGSRFKTKRKQAVRHTIYGPPGFSIFVKNLVSVKIGL